MRTTRRCVADDLVLDPDYSARDARYYCAEHEALRIFVIRREGAPEVGESISGIEPRGSVKSLHVGRGRGATRWDSVEDVCWLLAYNPTHATGERRDAYVGFLSLNERDALLPTADDYESLWEISSEALLDGFAVVGQRLLEQARSSPSAEVSGTYNDGSMMVLIDLMVIDGQHCEEGWVVFTFTQDPTRTTTQIHDLLDAILPMNVDADSVAQSSTFGARALQWHEVAFTWSCS